MDHFPDVGLIPRVFKSIKDSLESCGARIKSVLYPSSTLFSEQFRGNPLFGRSTETALHEEQAQETESSLARVTLYSPGYNLVFVESSDL